MPIVSTTSSPASTTTIPSTTTLTTTETPMRVKVDQQTLNEKMRSYSLVSEQDTYLDFIFQDDRGNPYDLSALPSNYVLKAVFNESVSGSPRPNPDVTLATETADKKKGKITIHLTKDQTGIPGVYKCAVACINTTNSSFVQLNEFYVYVANSISSGTAGPPSILEIRLQLRDTSPEENLLLDGLSFTDEEIALAVARPVMYFNELQPDVGVYYTTSNFPWRYHWVEGAIAQLFYIAAEYNRKNQLQYQAGGVALNDKSKEPNYLQAAEKHWALFVDYCKRKKVAINVNRGYRHVSSRYSRI